VRKHGEHKDPAGVGLHRLPFLQSHEGVNTPACVLKDITLRVPLRLLLKSPEDRNLWKVSKPTGLLEDPKPGGRPNGSRCPLGPFTPDPFHWKFAEGIGDRGAQACRCRIELKIESTGKLKGPKHAQGIFREGSAGVTEEPVAQVGLPAMGINQLTGEGVEGHGVYGEIPPGECLGWLHEWIRPDFEPPVADPCLPVGARETDIVVDSIPSEFDDPEALAHGIDIAKAGQSRRYSLGRNPVNLDIEVF